MYINVVAWLQILIVFKYFVVILFKMFDFSPVGYSALLLTFTIRELGFGIIEPTTEFQIRALLSWNERCQLIENGVNERLDSNLNCLGKIL